MPSKPTPGEWTLDHLAAAMRGMPRDALIKVRLPDGSLAGLRLVNAGYYGDDGRNFGGTDTGRYTIVLVTENAPSR